MTPDPSTPGPPQMPPAAFQQIHGLLLRLIPDLPGLQQAEARVSRRPPFMDLHLDVVLVQGKPPRMIRLALHQGYEQNGDWVPDPDMEIQVDLERQVAEALSFQDTNGYREVYPEPGQVNEAAQTDLNHFLLHWLANLLQQGHSLPPEAWEGA